LILEKKSIQATKEPERAIAVGVMRKGGNRIQMLEYLEELKFLAETAGANVVEKIYQEREKYQVSTMIGKGKIEEIKLIIDEEKITLVIFDDDLSAIQVRNLEKAFEVKVLDRSGIILDIFASRARSIEAKTQVELAQLQYMLPRLTRMWTHLSKQYGGIGTKGPGETQIETDRRIIRTRIQRLKEKLGTIEIQRELQRKSRSEILKFALVGYTNAGKSTLMNTLTQSGVYVENKLFATLDTTIRSLELPSGQKALLSDTVGFIRKLPTHLIASFRSTLAEASDANILIHVVDISHEMFEDQITTVDNTLNDLEIGNKPIIVVFNKIDTFETLENFADIESKYPNFVYISAERNINIRQLLLKMQETAEQFSKPTSFLIPYTRMEIVSQLYTETEVLERKDLEEGVFIETRIQKEKQQFFDHLCSNFVVKN